MKKIIIQSAFILGLFCSKTLAQTINTGQMTILNGTVFSTGFNFSNDIDATLINDGEFFVFADFNNDGIVDFTPGQKGYTRFEGSTAQKITGTASAENTKLCDVLFNNTSFQPAFHLFGDISISGISDFRNGVVDNEEYKGMLFFENKASHYNTSNESHVDGYVQKNGNQAFSYPIGDAGFFRYGKILTTSPNAATDAFTGKYFFQNSNFLYPHQRRVGNLNLIDDKEYWTVDRTKGESEIMLTLSWDKATSPEFIWKDLDPLEYDNETMTIARWDETKQLWVDIGGIVELGANGIESGSVTSFFTTSGFGVFTLAKVKKRTEAVGNIVVYNAVSPNEDGQNDYFKIDGIQHYPDNRVQIYNRWGIKVFETTNYDSNGNVFNGYSHGRTTVNSNEKLPSGTYYYILNYEFPDKGGSKSVNKAGFLYLNDN